MPITVIKLGGSALKLPRGVDRVRDWLATVEPRGCLLISGGGPAADLVRGWHESGTLTEEASHWLAIAAMGLNARFWAAVVPNCRLVASRQEAEAIWKSGLRAVLDPEPFLRAEEVAADASLPHNWDVTSDSLAAWIAGRWPAEQLVLVKVPPAPIGQRLTDVSRSGQVDSYFPGLAGQLPCVAWCSLSDASPEVIAWLRFGEPGTR